MEDRIVFTFDLKEPVQNRVEQNYEEPKKY